MKKIFSILVVHCLIGYNLSQTNVIIPNTGCPINTISTDPNNYLNASDPTSLKKWNWMTENFTVYYLHPTNGTIGFTETVRSPFFEMITNPNTLQFVDQIEKDYSPKNGWELLNRNFGSSIQGIKNPYFMLYNRYTGIIRVFVNIRNSGTCNYNSATITLLFANNPSKRRSAIFNQLGEITYAVNNYNNNARQSVLNQYTNSGNSDNYFWLTADFETMYDPCTCGIESDLQLQVNLISETQVTLSVNGQVTTIVDNQNPSTSEFNTPYLNTIKQWADLGTSLVADVQGVFSNANKAYSQGKNLQKDANDFIQHNNNLFGTRNTQLIAGKVGSLLYEVPNVNSWLAFASTLITVVKKVQGNITSLTTDQKLDHLSNITVTTKNTDLKVSGNLIQSSTYFDEIMALSGSNQSNIANNSFRKPIYNNPLGVINLLKQPIVKLTQFTPPKPLYYLSNGYYADNSQEEVFPTITRAEVIEEVNLILNPSSGLKIKSIESRLEFTNIENTNARKLKGLMTPGPLKTFNDFEFLKSNILDRESYHANLGYNLEMFTTTNIYDKALFSTPFLNYGCFKNTSLYSYSSFDNINVKVKVILEPINENSETVIDDIVYVLTYPAKIETSTSTYDITRADALKS